MDSCDAGLTNDWKNTKEAVANFRSLLLCSKCSQLMKDPVCLGTCEHMLCRSCAGPKAGDGCVVCQSPSWVKDIQINRQLSSIISHFCALESILNPNGKPDSSKGIQAESENTVLKHKKNFKIWFSPRSRKVRCMLETAPKFFIPESKKKTTEAQPSAPMAKVGDLTVFNFASSSQDSCSSSPTSTKNGKKKKKRVNEKNIGGKKKTLRRTTKKQQNVTIKKTLEAINEQWGKTEESVKRKSSKKVSFCSPAEKYDNNLSLVSGDSTLKDILKEGSIAAPNNSNLLCQNESDSVQDTLLDSYAIPIKKPTKQANLSPPQRSSKRSKSEDETITLETTPKRKAVSPGTCQKSLSHSLADAINSQSLSSPIGKRTPQRDGGESPPSASTGMGRKSPSSLGRCNSGTAAVMKKNHKGETPLHLAAIKGDVESVKELLDQGADPNLKDNAGWTPLHEACNLGHLMVVEALLSRGALLNTPGYENYSPLHDAVRNGHIAIVKLLLQFGASQSVLNLHGKRPADYAVSQEMLDIFQEASGEPQDANTSMNSPASLSLVDSCVKQDEIVLFLSSKLQQTGQHQFAKLSQLLDGRITDSFTSSVSHIVVPEGPTLRTYSILLGHLAGCWIVKYSWVEACLQAGKRMPENEHEAGEGPRRSRINQCSLLPPLFDGCFFFLLGSFKSPKKNELANLLREGGGQLLSRQPKPDSDVTQTLNAAAYHAMPGSDQALCTQYIIFDQQGPHKPAVVRRGKVWSAPSSWIIDCIAAFQLLPVPNLASE
ncbi:BRCA1-associated RING domain protein 1-like [Corythoichthys intestinalis]|uniref:BRCA1-associated RING domain protein 1-like n=1 Tax=Corythoichthys intestinalis TaxID=161448 RepID=UPI0025A5DD65|nr:BRCA1-associated RING domain protein 1-like [Corythoichthys intestinalis]XP_061799271.1 BRCA1-associated RING domain protein 1-like [Nerophis lumbriciformis]